MNDWRGLEQVLTKLIKEHEKLIELMERLEDAVSKRKIDELEPLLVEQREVCTTIACLDKERRNLCFKLVGRSVGNLLQVVSLAPKGYRKGLISLGNKLRRLVLRAQIESRTMRYVINTVLHYVGQLLDLYFSREISVYGADGQPRRKKGVLCSVKA